MRRPDNTIVFGSQGAPTSIAPTSVAPTSASLPPPHPRASNTEQWFKTPVVAQSDTGTAFPLVRPARHVHPTQEPTHTVGEDVLPLRNDRGLVFAAISLAMIAVAGAGTYFFLGAGSTAVRDPATTVSSTTVTNAEVPVTPPAAPAAPAPPATTTQPDLPWEPPVFDAVKAPNAPPKRIEGTQVAPPTRAEPKPAAPAAVAPAPKPKSDMVPSFDDATLERAGFYRPNPNAINPSPAPSPPTTPTTEMVPPLTTPPVLEPEAAPKAAPEPADAPTPAPTDVLPEMTIKR